MASTVRDRQAASRSVGYLTLIAAPYVFVTCLVDHPTSAVLAIVTVISVLFAGAGAFCLVRPRAVPDAFWALAPIICTVVITGLNLLTHDASTGAQLFYLWPVLYAANFLSRRVNYISMAAVYGGAALSLFTVGEAQAGSDWAALVLAMTMAAVVVFNLRERADRLLRVLERQALADPLTGLANRRSFDDELARAGAWARRTGLPLALLTIDVDHFKAINDTWGHTVGDEALQAVARAMAAATRAEDLAARLGGDEFAMLLRADRTGAVRVAEAVRAAVGEVTTLPGGPPSLSIGVAVLPDDGATVQQLVKASDDALYEAKTGGRGRVASLVPAP